MIPDQEYHTEDFERTVSLRARSEAIAKHLTEFMKKNGRFDKTIVFCVDQDHADVMRRLLNNLNTDLVQRHPDYVCRVTSDEGDIGRGHLSRFQDLESDTPVILTTSQLLTTGVDAETVKNVVLVRVVGSMTEFKQIIGRGTRVRCDYGKLFFNILDYTGTATEKFADPDFDGFPAMITEVQVDENGSEIEGTQTIEQPEENIIEDEPPVIFPTGQDSISDDDEGVPRKFYVDGGHVEIVAHVVQELDTDGKQLRVISFTDYTAEKVRTLYPSAAEMRKRWADPEGRSSIIAMLEERGITFDELAAATNQPEADPFDLLCNLAFNAPLRTRRERADHVRRERKEFFERYSPEARNILNELLDKYAEQGTAQFVVPDILEVPPISNHGNVVEIADLFGGPAELQAAVNELQNLLYAA